jgi:signal transduction histidine kinase
MWLARRLEHLAVRIPLIMLGTIFVVESAIMTAFALTGGERPHRWLEVVFDSSALTLTLAPLLYWLIVRPLQELAEERWQLLAHMIEIQDAERRRVARDLHDEIGQSFTSLLVQLRILEDAPSLDAAKERARDLRTLSAIVYDQIRNLSRGLHPDVLDDLGLAEAVRMIADDFESAHGIAATVRVSGFSKERLDRKVETAAYRIVQESLTNCAKHAQATRVDMSLVLDQRVLTVSVADNGCGFDADKAMHAPSAATFGLRSMRERALLLHGSFTVSSRPGQGTTVTMQVSAGDQSHAEDSRVTRR